jgi:hypothetical protein
MYIKHSKASRLIWTAPARSARERKASLGEFSRSPSPFRGIYPQSLELCAPAHSTKPSSEVVSTQENAIADNEKRTVISRSKAPSEPALGSRGKGGSKADVLGILETASVACALQTLGTI